MFCYFRYESRNKKVFNCYTKQTRRYNVLKADSILVDKNIGNSTFKKTQEKTIKKLPLPIISYILHNLQLLPQFKIIF